MTDAELQRRIEVVRAMHVPEDGWIPPECRICGDGAYPCETIRALDGEE